MPDWILAGTAYFFFVFFKAMQQRNVAFLHYGWIMPVSFLMSTADVFVVSLVAVTAVKGGFDSLVPLVVAISVGSGLGSLLAMWLHNKYITRRL